MGSVYIHYHVKWRDSGKLLCSAGDQRGALGDDLVGWGRGAVQEAGPRGRGLYT